MINLPGTKLVFLNFSRRGYLYVAPFVYILCSIFNVKFALRMFGGDNRNEMIAPNSLGNNFRLQMIRNADFLFFETKAETEYFKQYNKQTHWFPNCRAFNTEFIPRTYHKRFVFISQLKEDKGIRILLNAFEKLGKEYNLEIYGPVIDKSLSFLEKNSMYKGIIPFDSVYDALNKNDVLLLPTFYKSEGYPGIIIEAYAMSVPVITTKWKSIPDMVNHGESGFLIGTNSVDELVNAIQTINEVNYPHLNKAAYDMSHAFKSDIVHKRIFEIIQPALISN